MTDEEGKPFLCFHSYSDDGKSSFMRLYLKSVEWLLSWCEDLRVLAIEKIEYDKIVAEQKKQQEMAEEAREQLKKQLQQKAKAEKKRLQRIKRQEIIEPSLFD